MTDMREADIPPQNSSHHSRSNNNGASAESVSNAMSKGHSDTVPSQQPRKPLVSARTAKIKQGWNAVI